MTRLRSLRLVAAVTLLALAGAGCAARWAYRQGQDAAEKRDWDLAVARFTRALDKDPKNIGYKIALENARIQASRYPLRRSEEARVGERLREGRGGAGDRVEVRSLQPLGRGRPGDRAESAS